MRTYAIGDIHGHLEKLRAAHALIAADRAAVADDAAPVVHVGDLVDRGPDSCGVIDHLIDGQERGEPWVVLKGNHDRMFARYLDNPEDIEPGLRSGLGWLSPSLGGFATLTSYGVADPLARPLDEVHAEALDRVPARHRAFLAGLPVWRRFGAALFVHAGIRPGVAMAEQDEDDLIWIRSPFLEDRRDYGALVVHGHTPVEAPTHYGNRLNIDSGAAFGGALSAVAIEGRSAWLLTRGGRVPLFPSGW